MSEPLQKPEPPQKPRGSIVSILLAASLAVAVVTGLIFITLGLFGPVLAIAGAIFGFAALHYVVWGWWLPRMIYEEDEAERQAEARRDEQNRM